MNEVLSDSTCRRVNLNDLAEGRHVLRRSRSDSDNIARVSFAPHGPRDSSPRRRRSYWNVCSEGLQTKQL